MKNITFFIFILMPFFLQAKEKLIKSTLLGTIKDAKTKEPLIGASIFIHDIKIGTISKLNGEFVTTSFQSGTYLVEVSYQGYASMIESIEVSGKTTKHFLLQEAVVEQDAVTITGTTSATKIKNNPQAVNVVSKADLFKINSTNIIDMLAKTVPGFSTLSTGPVISKPIIRGLGYNRMVTINDGIRQEGQQWGDEHGIEIDAASIQKVEVLKGAASLVYGSDAIAGVLNFLSNQTVQQGTVKANIAAGYLDNNKMYNTYSNVAAHLNNGINFNFYSSLKSAADYENKYDAKVFNSRFKEQNFGGYFGINKHWGYSHLLISNFKQTVGMIEGSRDAVTGLFTVFAATPNEHIATSEELASRNFYTPYQHINHFKIGVDNMLNLKKGRLTFNVAFQQNQRKEFGDYLTTTTPSLFFDLQTINYNAQYHFNEKKGWKTTVGIGGMKQQNNNNAAEVLIPEYNQFDIGSFIVAKKAFKKIVMTTGLRVDARNLFSKDFEENGNKKFASINRVFNNVSGSIGASYNASKHLTLKLNIARGFRAPTVSELSSNGTHEGTNRYEYGNSNLTSETSFQIDAAIEANTEHVSFALTPFYNAISNYIFYNKLNTIGGADSLVDDGSGNLIQAFQFNQANAALAGFEVNLDIHPHPLDWLHIQNSFSLVSGKFKNEFAGSKNLPFMAPARLLTELKADFKSIGKLFRRAYAKFEIDNTLTQKNIFAAYNTETITPAYTLLNLSVGSDIKIWKDCFISAAISINNIADIAYQSHLSRLKYTDVNNATQRVGVFNMGRNIGVKINLPLSFTLK